MDADLRAEARRIFMEARDLPPEKRTAFLEQACAGKPQLRAEVDADLAAHDAAGSFLADPTATAGAAVTESTRDATPGDALPTPNRAAATPKDEESIGAIIGPYKLVRHIGRGGFGDVYLAEQREPLIRKVALKILQRGVDPEVIARFEAERQILARMEHPNIARVIDAGVTVAKRPYIVMEWVDGEPITQYCDRNKLTIPARLGLFRQVCTAVQHAHMKGVIHRDIKPGNVLVEVLDEQPVAKVIDFGIAKATEGEGREPLESIARGERIGTPAYMSPEQAKGTPDIDTRTDVYSLGVLLYELLTGSTPFTTERLRLAAIKEMLRIIQDEKPPAPSTRLSDSTDTLAEVATCRGTEPRRLGATVRGELDWIVMKSLEKERERRYSSAKDLAGDIENYLEGRPVIAAAPGKGYRARKFLRRHRRGVLVAASIAIAIAIAGITSISSFRNGIRADTQEKAADALFGLFDRTLDESDPYQSGRRDLPISAVLLNTANRLVEGDLAEQPEIRANLLMQCVLKLTRIGMGEVALRPAQEALAIVRARHAGDHQSVAHALNSLAMVYQDIGQMKKAEELLTEALAMSRRIFSEPHPDIAQNLSDLALIKTKNGPLADAEPLFMQSLDMYKNYYPSGHADTATVMKNIADLRFDLERFQEAEPYYSDAATLRKRIFPGDHPGVARVLLNLAVVLEMLNRPDEAWQAARESFGMYSHHLEWPEVEVAGARDTFIRLSKTLKKHSAAARVLRESVAPLTASASELRRQHTLAALELSGDLASTAAGLTTFEVPSEAVPLLRDCLLLRAFYLPEESDASWKKYNTMSLLGEAVYRAAIGPPAATEPATVPASQPDEVAIRAALAEAEGLMLNAWEKMKGDANVPLERRRDALARLAPFYNEWDRFEPSQERADKAVHWQRELEVYDKDLTTQSATTQPG